MGKPPDTILVTGALGNAGWKRSTASKESADRPSISTTRPPSTRTLDGGSAGPPVRTRPASGHSRMVVSLRTGCRSRSRARRDPPELSCIA